MKNLHKLNSIDEVSIRLQSAYLYAGCRYTIVYKDNKYWLETSKTDLAVCIKWDEYSWQEAIKQWIRAGRPITDRVYRA